MDEQAIEKTARQLDSRVPVIGAKLRRSACAKLAEDSGPLAVPHLVNALGSDDAEVAHIAEGALRALANQDAIDALCAAWANGRDVRLGEIVATCGYVATKPVEVRALSALKSGRPEAMGGGVNAFRLVVGCLADRDDDVKSRAEAILTNLTSPPAIDLLCDIALADQAGAPARIVKEKDYQPSEISRRCVFFLLTGQIERYLDLDFEFQHLRAEYDVADEPLKRRIAEVVRRSGDARLVGLFGAKERRGSIEKRASDLDEGEAAVVLEVYARNARWAEVFSMLFQIPLSSAVSALRILGKSGWQPENEQDAALLTDLVRLSEDVGEIPAAPPEPDVALGTVFGKWIRAGREGDAASASAEQLRSRLKDSSPPDAMAALSALSAKGQVTPRDTEAARTHKHWPVRLACLALCEIAPEFAFSDAPVGGDGGGMWIDRLAPPILDSAVYRHRGIALNLEQVESLQGALKGKGGQNKQRAACGQILCALGAYHLRHTIEIDEEMVVRVSETEIEIEG